MRTIGPTGCYKGDDVISKVVECGIISKQNKTAIKYQWRAVEKLSGDRDENKNRVVDEKRRYASFYIVDVYQKGYHEVLFSKISELGYFVEHLSRNGRGR